MVICCVNSFVKTKIIKKCAMKISSLKLKCYWQPYQTCSFEYLQKAVM